MSNSSQTRLQNVHKIAIAQFSPVFFQFRVKRSIYEGQTDSSPYLAAEVIVYFVINIWKFLAFFSPKTLYNSF